MRKRTLADSLRASYEDDGGKHGQDCEAFSDAPAEGSRAHWLLREALRRYTMFGEGKPLILAWTGLGSATQYEPAVRLGLMEYATRPNPGYATWWRLTIKGAQIVQDWIDTGVEIGGAS